MQPLPLRLLSKKLKESGCTVAFDLRWPFSFEWLIDALSVFQLNIFGIVELGCLGSWSFYSALILQATVMPIVLTAALAAMYMARRGSLVDKPDVLEQLYDRLLEFGFTFFFLVYPIVSQVIFQTFMCVDLDGGDGEQSSLLLVDFQTSCNTDTHSGYLVFATIMVVLWPIGLPTWCFYLLFSNRDELRKEGSLVREELSPLVENYKLDCWYWESLELMRKVFLTGLMCFFRRGSTEQLIFGAIVSGLFLAASVSKRPFVTKYDNDFKIVTDAALMITFNLSLLLKDSDDGPVPLWVLGAVLVIVNVIAPLVLVSINIHGWRKRQKQEKQLAASKNGDATTFANPLDAEE